MPRTLRSTPRIKTRAIALRKDSTPAEVRLWAHIRNGQLGVNFRRQHAIGNFITDFCAIKEKLIIELDGSQHLEQQAYDHQRTRYLRSQGYTVIRFWNHEVMQDINTVIQTIQLTLAETAQESHHARKIHPA
jgi:very-short-patch-repair endonuclease